MTQRVGFVLRVKPERLDEYVRLHAEVWPEMLEALNGAGIRNDSDSATSKGVRFARNVVHHQWADALQFQPGGEIGVLMVGVSGLGTSSRWVWRDEDQLPRSRSARHGQQEYGDALQGHDVHTTLVTVGELAQKLPIPEQEP